MSDDGSHEDEFEEFPPPPYHLLPLHASPLLRTRPPALPAPRSLGTSSPWTISTHLFPAAYPRSHELALEPAVPTAAVSSDEKDQRKLDFEHWAKACKSMKLGSFIPPKTREEAEGKANKMIEVQGNKALWGCVERWTNNQAPADGIVLLCAHANGFHKEIWQPMLEKLLAVSQVPIAEVWSLDTVDSGYAGFLNQATLGPAVPWVDHARDILCLLAHLPSVGASAPTVLASPSTLDYATAAAPAGGRRVVGVSHSFSGQGLLLSAYTRPQAFDGLFVIDGVLPSGEAAVSVTYAVDVPIARGAIARKAVFASREDANTYYNSKPFFQSWHPKVLELHQTYGLVPLEPSHPANKAVTLAMSKFREAAAFGNTWNGAFGYEAARVRRHRCKIHFVRMSGTAVPTVDSDELAEELGGDFKELEGGHLVVQEQPDMIGESDAESVGGAACSDCRVVDAFHTNPGQYAADLFQRWYGNTAQARL